MAPKTKHSNTPLTCRRQIKWLVIAGFIVMSFMGANPTRANDKTDRDAPKKIGHTSQLFFDDYMIYAQHGLVRKAQPGKKRSKPVLMPEHPWEYSYGVGGGIGKIVYGLGTVLYDPLQKQYRMWYMGRMSAGYKHEIPELKMPGGGNKNGDLLLYATSKDGINWDRPNLGICHFNGDANNNIMLDLHGVCVVIDDDEPDPQKRYKAIGFCRRFHDVKRIYSPDGIHWSEMEHAFKRRTEGPIGLCYFRPVLRKNVCHEDR